MTRQGVLSDWEWNVIRKVVYWILMDLDGRIELRAGGFMPETIRELDLYARGLSFEFQLDETLEFTREALRKVANDLATVHRVAAAVQVNAPSTQQINDLKEDLQKINQHLKNGQRFKTAMALAGSIADILDGLKNKKAGS